MSIVIVLPNFPCGSREENKQCRSGGHLPKPHRFFKVTSKGLHSLFVLSGSVLVLPVELTVQHQYLTWTLCMIISQWNVPNRPLTWSKTTRVQRQRHLWCYSCSDYLPQRKLQLSLHKQLLSHPGSQTQSGGTFWETLYQKLDTPTEQHTVQKGQEKWEEETKSKGSRCWGARYASSRHWTSPQFFIILYACTFLQEQQLMLWAICPTAHLKEKTKVWKSKCTKPIWNSFTV